MTPTHSNLKGQSQALSSNGMHNSEMSAQRKRNVRKWLSRLGYTIVILMWVILTLGIIWPVVSDLDNSASVQKPPNSGGANYLVIAPNALKESATAWADYRKGTGYDTRLVILSPGQVEVAIIRDLIQKAYSESGKPYPFYVLLIGHAHPFSSNPDTFLPAAHFSIDQIRASRFGEAPIASDDGYASLNPSGVPDHLLPISIGRIPARTEEESFSLLERTKDYEENPPTGEGRARIDLVSSNAGFGPQFDPIFEWLIKVLIQKLLPNEFQWHMLSGNSSSPYSHPINTLPNEVASRLDSGALALVYIGHAQPDMLCCASSTDGEAERIFSIADATLIDNANSSLGIFTACSAGIYDLIGDDLSVVESIYLTPGGPVATYSSSAWINASLNGRLVIDVFETLMNSKPYTIGEWVNQIESWSQSTAGDNLLTATVKASLPRLRKVYDEKLFFSPSQAHQELDIQHATYNLFGDPALTIAYAKSDMEVSPTLIWQPWKGSLAFSGKTDLVLDQEVLITLEKIPGNGYSRENQTISVRDRYLQANSLVIATEKAFTLNDGNISGKITIPPNTPSGKYLLRAIAVQNNDTQIAVHPIYIGLPPVTEMLSSPIFWWLVVTIFLIISVFVLRRRKYYQSKKAEIIST